MNPVTMDFVRRWRWLLVIQFAATALSWIQPEGRGKLHLEMVPAVAMSWDYGRGLVRSCLGLPLTRPVVARGLWLAVAGVSPVLGLAGMMAAVVCCRIFGMTPPPAGLLSFHLVISLLLAGTMQLLLTGLPTRPAASLSGQIKDGVVGLLWGLSMSAMIWVSFVFPAGWEWLGWGDAIILNILGVAAVASFFTTRGMLIRRAGPGPGTPPACKAATGRYALHGAGGWQLWLGQELRWLAPALFMVLIVMGSMELMARASSPGVSTAIRSGPNQYRAVGLMCAMFILPLFGMAAGPARIFCALPITRGRYALLLACRPVVFCLSLVLMFTGLSWLAGQGTGQEGRALCVFILFGSLVSLMQAVLVRQALLPVAMGMAMVLAPMVDVSFLILLQSGMPVFWMAVLGAGLLPISWLLHRRWLRTSSQIYRSQQWLMRFAAGQSR